MRFAGLAGRLLLFVGMVLFLPLSGFAVGHIIVYALDSSKTNTPPPSATAILDGGTLSQSFGTNSWLMFSNLSAGTHMVEVTVAAGYLPRESPTVPNAIDDPDSAYGNPRHVEVVDNEPIYPSFLFDPVVTASAVVRDAWTMERLEDADIEFVVNGGPYDDLEYTEFPWEASYASNWCSDAEGDFPSNTILYLDNYDLNITCSGYQSYSSNSIVTNATVNDVIDFGELFLLPTDSNTNLISDAWETLYFGSGSNVVADADADGDDMCNRDEYVAGTDPTNGLSCLIVFRDVDDGELELTWSTESWRSYCVMGTTNLCTIGSWVQLGGAWEATNGQSIMTWVNTNLDLCWYGSFRVSVVPCNWSETNQVLINTNGPPILSGDGGGSTNWPPMP